MEEQNVFQENPVVEPIYNEWDFLFAKYFDEVLYENRVY